MDALEVLRRSDVPMVMVHDEYGHFEGIVTPGGTAHFEFVNDDPTRLLWHQCYNN